MWFETTKTILRILGEVLARAGEGSAEIGSAISTPAEEFSLHGVPDDLAGGEGHESVPTAHVTLFFPHYINNY